MQHYATRLHKIQDFSVIWHLHTLCTICYYMLLRWVQVKGWASSTAFLESLLLGSLEHNLNLLNKGQKESKRNPMPNVPTCSALWLPVLPISAKKQHPWAADVFGELPESLKERSYHHLPTPSICIANRPTNPSGAPSKQYRRTFVFVASCFLSLVCCSGFIQVAPVGARTFKQANSRSPLHSTWGSGSRRLYAQAARRTNSSQYLCR